MKIELKQHQGLWFTSDTHYNHTNICRGTTKWIDADSVTRDFDSLESLDEPQHRSRNSKKYLN